jgi:hypothetical protein
MNVTRFVPHLILAALIAVEFALTIYYGVVL